MTFRQVKWDMLHPFSDNAQWHSVFGQKNMQHSQVLWTTNSCWKFVNCSIQEGCYISHRNCKHVCTATGYMYEWSGFWVIFIPLSHTTTQNKLTKSVTYSAPMSFTSAQFWKWLQNQEHHIWANNNVFYYHLQCKLLIWTVLDNWLHYKLNKITED